MALEQVILDDASIAVGRTALNLNSGSIKVAEGGIDWGDAAIEPYLADMSRGSAPVDFRVPNRQVSIPLILGANGQSGYSTARRNVQAKAALHQREGGWLKRVMKNGEVCYLDVVNATLRLSGDSSASQLDIDGNALLTLDTLPDFYGDEITLSDHTETTSPELIFTEATVKGDYPGRLRLVVDDDQGVDQRGLIAGFRARNYSNASTAALVYAAQSLTALDTASSATVASRASVRHSTLAATWTPVLGTNLTAGTFLTHVGAYRVWAYVYTSSTTTVKARFVSDVGDLVQPAENDPVTIPGSSNWYLMDLGQIYLDKMPVGSHRWAGQVQAKGASGGENIAVARLMFQPLDESACKIQAQTASTYITAATGRDAFNQTAGNLTGGKTTNNISGVSAANPGVITVTAHGLSNGALVWIEGATGTAGVAINGYRTVANATTNTFTVGVNTTGLSYTSGGTVSLVGKALDVGGSWFGTGSSTDLAVESTGHTAQRSAVSDASTTAGRFAIAAALGAMTGSAAQVDVKFSTILASSYSGVIVRYSDVNNWFGAFLTPAAGGVVLFKMKAGSLTAYSPVNTLSTNPNTWYSVKLTVDGSGNYVVYGSLQGGSFAIAFVGNDADLASGGTLASGRVGIADINTGVSAVTRNMDNFSATPVLSDAVVFASRTAQLTTQGNFRQDSTGTAYGPTAPPNGDLLRIPPSGLEGRTVECLVKMSRGNLSTEADGGIDDLSARLYYRPCWLTAPGS